MPNHLIRETSPYLLQHAHNPVDWYPWGEEALQKAITENKPILVSIGYAACHWCHVMERESFEDVETAALMNAHFVNIKIDREERPDIDQIYMDAVQTMTGSGGWPLNVFLTPHKKPFYGGTYYPPRPYANRPSWKDILMAVSDAFKNKRKEIEEQADRLTQHLVEANSFGLNDIAKVSFSLNDIDTACSHLLGLADTRWGGFGRPPKFPQTQCLRFLLRYAYFEQQRAESFAQKALEQALLSLDKMMEGGIYDQVGGGFARYSTDEEWLVPHFEKMLYDNALLATTFSEAYQFTKEERYKKCIDQTLAFIERELQEGSGGFYSALDADSEGVEGKFYVWSKKEATALLGNDAACFCAYYDITEAGNWEGENIPRVLKPLKQFAIEKDIPETSLEALLMRGKGQLLSARQKRTRPGLDDKVILGWNALMNIAYGKAFEATGNDHYREKAIANMQFLLEAFEGENGKFFHVWKKGIAKHPAFLDDLAYLIAALLQLHRITANTSWLQKAKMICEQVRADFSEEASGLFYYTPVGQQDVLLRKREIYDGATPSGNAVMAENLLALSLLFDIPDWRRQAEQMIRQLSDVIIKYPTSFGAWLLSFYRVQQGGNEIVLVGDYKKVYKDVLSNYFPHSIIMATAEADDRFPLLNGKTPGNPLWIYLCRNYSCERPVKELPELYSLLNGKKNDGL